MNSPSEQEVPIDLESSSVFELDRISTTNHTRIDSAESVVTEQRRPPRSVNRELLSNEFPAD